MRVSRKKSSISVVAIRRTINAAMGAGLPIDRLDVEPDGTIRLNIATPFQPVQTMPDDLFREWESRL